MRLVTLFSSRGGNDPLRSIYLNVFNLKDKARCQLKLAGNLGGLPPINIAIDDDPQSVTDEAYQSYDVMPGQTFRAWMGNSGFNRRNRNYGHAEVRWLEPQPQAK